MSNLPDAFEASTANTASPAYHPAKRDMKVQNLINLEQLQEQLKIQQEQLFQQQRALFLQDNLGDFGQSRNWSFTQGLIFGQLSVFVVIVIFIKFFVFADPSPTKAINTKDALGVIVRRDKNDKREVAENGDKLEVPESLVKVILEKTYYDVDNHSRESLDWFNVLIAQTIAHLRTEALLSDNIYHSLNEFMSLTDMPDYLDTVKITEIDIGDDFPIFSNCRIKQSSNSERLEAKIDVDLSDTLSLGIETKILLNHPRPLTAVLPVQLSVSIVRFSGCLTVSLINTNDPEFHKTTGNDASMDGTALMFLFSSDYRLEFTVKSLIGSRAKLQNVPKISSLIENKLRSWFNERCIEPRFQVVKLPSLWPRKRNTREPVGESEGSS